MSQVMRLSVFIWAILTGFPQGSLIAPFIVSVSNPLPKRCWFLLFQESFTISFFIPFSKTIRFYSNLNVFHNFVSVFSIRFAVLHFHISSYLQINGIREAFRIFSMLLGRKNFYTFPFPHSWKFSVICVYKCFQCE